MAQLHSKARRETHHQRACRLCADDLSRTRPSQATSHTPWIDPTRAYGCARSCCAVPEYHLPTDGKQAVYVFV